MTRHLLFKEEVFLVFEDCVTTVTGCTPSVKSFCNLSSTSCLAVDPLQHDHHALLHVDICSTCDGRANMYKRDVAVVIVSFLALFLCLQHEGNFSFRKAWYHVTLHESEQLDGLRDRIEDLPAPLVADLNGDGHLEVIVATHEYTLQLLRPEPPGRAGEGFAPVEVVKSFSLLPQKVMLGSDRRPVAMAVGYIDPDPHEKVRPLRKQVLVVVTASWQVLCFDHNLVLMWEVAMEESLPHNAHLNEVSVLVTSHQVRQGHRGLIIIGSSLELGDIAAVEAGEAAAVDASGRKGGGIGGAGGEGKLLEGVLQEELRFEAEEMAKAHGQAGVTGRMRSQGNDGDAANKEGPGSKDGVDTSRHFNYYAFEGGSGEQVWKHTSGAFQKNLADNAEELRPQHDFRMHANALAGRHFGEMSCREFRESVLAVLPQEWTRPADCHLEEALFVKHKEGAGQQKQQLAKLAYAKASGRPGHANPHPRKQRPHGISFSHILGTPSRSSTKRSSGNTRSGLVVSRQQNAAAAAQAGMAYRHAHLAHNGTANAVVAHVQDGIEAVHLYSGRTLCKLHLPSDMLHADINGDGVIDHIAVGGSGSGAAGPLGVAASRSHAVLGPCTAFATSGLPPKHVLWRVNVCARRHGLTHAIDGSRIDDSDELESAEFAPPVFLPVPRADGTYSHLRGQQGIVVFASNDGTMTALNARGATLWQRYFGAGWASDGDDASVPTLTTLALRPDAIPSAILAVGYDTGVIVSEHGNELASFHVAFPPSAPAVIADFDGDGLNDVIIVTRNGVFGYSQVQHLGGLSFGALLLTLIVSMAIVWYSQFYDSGANALVAAASGGLAGLMPVGMTGASTGAARVRKLRSTEYVD